MRRPVAFLALAGCACPTFDEIAVTSTATPSDTVDPEAGVDAVTAALADFAAWTAREGVCVDEIRLQDEVLADSPDGPVAVAGLYHRAARRIDIQAEPPVRSVTIHELCHALDEDEALSRDEAALFDADTIAASGLYRSDSERIREAFAEACEAGPEGLVVREAAAEACGDDLGAEQARFLRDVVYPGFEHVGTLQPGAPLDALDWRSGFDHVFTTGFDTHDLGGDDAGFLLLALRYGIEGTPPALRLYLHDTATGDLLDQAPLPLPDDVPAWGAEARLVPTDTGRAWVIVRNGRQALVDPDAGVVLAPTETLDPFGGAVSEGVFYGATAAAPLSAWDVATGARLDVPVEGLPDGAIDEVFPLEGGVGIRVGSTVARLWEGRWIPAPPLDGLAGAPIERGGALTFLVDTNNGWQPVRLDAAWSAWSVDPFCEAPPTEVQTRLITAAGRPFVGKRNYPDVELLVAELPD